MRTDISRHAHEPERPSLHCRDSVRTGAHVQVMFRPYRMPMGVEQACMQSPVQLDDAGAAAECEPRGACRCHRPG